MKVDNGRMYDGSRSKNAIDSVATSLTVPNGCSNYTTGNTSECFSEHCSDVLPGRKRLSVNANFVDCELCTNNSVFRTVVDTDICSGVQNISDSRGENVENSKCSQCSASANNSFVINGYNNVVALSGACKSRRENEVKLKHISFDCAVNSKKEYELKPCPSLDSSLASQSCPSKQSSVCNVDVFSSTSLDPCDQCEPQSSLPPATPSTPASGVVSQASLDSGVLSTHSFDFFQNFGLEILDKRRRTASSVSSGIGEMWQSSLDGETSKEMGVEESQVYPPGSASAVTSLNIDGNNYFSNFVNSVCEDNNENRRRTHGSGPKLSQVHTMHNSNSAHSQENDSCGFLKTMSASDDVSLSVIYSVASSENSISVATSVENINFTSSQNSAFVTDLKETQKGSIHVDRGKDPSEEWRNPQVQKAIEKFALHLVMLVLNEAVAQSISLGWSIKCSGQCNQELCREDFKKKCSSRDKKERENDKSIFATLGISSCSSSLCWTPELPFSPSHRTYSRTSKRSSLSFSHDSLVGCPPCQDDSHLIKGAVSHDVLSFANPRSAGEKKGVGCTICLEDDIYSLPVDMVKPYDGTILQPKVIIQQPKKRMTATRCVKMRSETEISSKRIHNNNNVKERSIKHKQKSKHNSTVTFESFTTKRNGSHASADDLLELRDRPSESNELDQGKSVGRSRNRQRRESRCTDQSKFCKIIPFTTGKTHKKKEICDTKLDKKKSRSLSSNIRNTLITLFSFRKTPKEQGNFINAKDEFIEASSQELDDSSEGLKWGKICPLPSAPPLVTSVKYSAFSERVGSVNTSAVIKSTLTKKSAITSSESNCSHSTNFSPQARQSNSISPASLLSCLGHPRTNSIDEQEHRSKSRKCSDMPKPSLSIVTKRALPPLPPPLGGMSAKEGKEIQEGAGLEWRPHTHNKLDEGCDFASIIEKVKNYGWYWGPISGEAAEKVLSNEPDGSFIVRDSSDYHYIFSLTFRLNGVTRHVRIEHDQGNFSFGGFTRFKSQTIVDFIEKAVEHSRSGRYLFFLHRRPVLGPMRVQLLHPVSRFKHVQSLQHLCRFVIVKQVRKDLIHDLPLPQRLKDYLSSPHYYSEQVEQCMSSSSLSLEGAIANADNVSHSPSPCLQHSSQLRFNNNNDCGSSMVPNSVVSRPFPTRISFQEPLDPVQFRTLQCNLNDPGTSFCASAKYPRSRDLRLSSSHSSLENFLYPGSPSPISSGSNSGRPNSHFCNSKFSLRKRGAPAIWSSHSSPSSPVPFDYSPDWLSSSDDFPIQASCTKVLSLQVHNNSQKRSEDSSKISLDKKKKSLESECGQSASTTVQSVTDAFLIDEIRKPKILLSPSSTIQDNEDYDRHLCESDKRDNSA